MATSEKTGYFAPWAYFAARVWCFEFKRKYQPFLHKPEKELTEKKNCWKKTGSEINECGKSFFSLKDIGNNLSSFIKFKHLFISEQVFFQLFSK